MSEDIRKVVDNDVDPEATTVLYIAMGVADDAVVSPYLSILCDDRLWMCLRKEEIPVNTTLLMNFDTAFAVEVQLLTLAHSVLLERKSTMSWVVMGERKKRGLEFGLYGDFHQDNPQLPFIMWA